MSVWLCVCVSVCVSSEYFMRVYVLGGDLEGCGVKWPRRQRMMFVFKTCHSKLSDRPVSMQPAIHSIKWNWIGRVGWLGLDKKTKTTTTQQQRLRKPWNRLQVISLLTYRLRYNEPISVSLFQTLAAKLPCIKSWSKANRIFYYPKVLKKMY